MARHYVLPRCGLHFIVPSFPPSLKTVCPLDGFFRRKARVSAISKMKAARALEFFNYQILILHWTVSKLAIALLNRITFEKSWFS